MKQYKNAIFHFTKFEFNNKIPTHFYILRMLLLELLWVKKRKHIPYFPAHNTQFFSRKM